jgi:hypothetical protein
LVFCSPHLEIFNQKDIEVLLLSDRVDEWMVSNFGEFDGIPLKSIAKGDLEDLDSKEEKAKKEKTAKDFDKVIEKMGKILENQVKEVKISNRLSFNEFIHAFNKLSRFFELSAFTEYRLVKQHLDHILTNLSFKFFNQGVFGVNLKNGLSVRYIIFLSIPRNIATSSFSGSALPKKRRSLRIKSALGRLSLKYPMCSNA